MKTPFFSSILQRHQGLTIRSEIKQTLAVLRKNDFPQYISELSAFLNDKEIRFHLWLLVVNELAFQDEPTGDEWRIAKSLFDKKLEKHNNNDWILFEPLSDANRDFTTHFWQALQGEGWLAYLHKYGYILRFLETGDIKIIRLVVWKLVSLINTCTNIVLDVLWHFPNIENRDQAIGGILTHLKCWESPRAIQLFEQYLPIIKTFSEPYPYYEILESVFPYQAERVCQIFFADLRQKVESISSSEDFDKHDIFNHQEIELLQKIQTHETTEKVSLSEGIAVIQQLVEQTRFQDEVSYYNDSAFSGIEQFGQDLYPHWTFLTLVKEQLQRTAQQNPERFLDVIAESKSSFSYTLLRLLIQGYLSRPEIYIIEGFELLCRPNIFEYLVHENSNGYEIRTLLNTLYPLFSSKQKAALNTIILSVKPEWESSRRAGWVKYRLLCAIPKNELQHFPELVGVFDELYQKFGGYEEQPPQVNEMTAVGPPLKESDYESMTLEEWLASFLQYNDSTGWDQPGESFLKGGIVEHSRRFTEEVAKRPDDFYEFVFSLGQRHDVSLVYLEAGLDGLIKAKYHANKIVTFIKAYNQYQNSTFRRSIVQAIEYVDKQIGFDKELLEILADYAVHDSDPTEDREINDPLNYGINTVRGAAALRLATHGYKTLYADRLFEIMEQIAADPSIAVRCCLITNLQGMLRWDHEKTYRIFITATRDENKQVIQYGLSCLAYLMKKENFLTFIPHLKIAMQLDQRIGYEHIQDYTGQILMLAYVRDYPTSQELLEEALLISEHAKIGAVTFAAKHLLATEQAVAQKSAKIFLRYLNEASEGLGHAYDASFHDAEPRNFNQLYPFIEQYVTSKTVYYASHWFFDYLIKCLEFEPEKCLDVLSQYLKTTKGIQRTRYVREKEHLQLLVGAYNKLRDETYKEKAMDMFDMMLQSPYYKQEGLKVLETQDRE